MAKFIPSKSQLTKFSKLMKRLQANADYTAEDVALERKAFFKSEAAFNKRMAEYDESLPGGVSGRK